MLAMLVEHERIKIRQLKPRILLIAMLTSLRVFLGRFQSCGPRKIYNQPISLFRELAHAPRVTHVVPTQTSLKSPCDKIRSLSIISLEIKNI